MEFYQKLGASLDSIASNGSELLRQSENVSTGTGPYEDKSEAIHHPRKKLMESAMRLLHLVTMPEEYLDHLANGVRFTILLPHPPNLTRSTQHADIKTLHPVSRVDLRPMARGPRRPAARDGSIAYPELAAKAGVPEKHLKGVARMAVLNGFLEEPASGRVAHGRPSALLVRDENFMSWARWMMDYSMPVAYKFAEATRRWGDTDAKNQTAFNVAEDTADPFFDHVRKNPDLTAVFSGYMRNVTASRPWSLAHAVECFDWASLPPGAKVVDVGGSHGQLAVEVASGFPHLQFVVQDLPETVEAAQKAFEADKGIEPAVKARIRFMPADFFQPQAVLDAHVYFLRMIIHDWPDGDARVILRNLRAALEANPGARILIMDTILPPPGSTTLQHEQQLRVRDLMMMQVFNARERELENWKALLGDVGMEIDRLRQPDDSVMGLLTVRLQNTAPPPGSPGEFVQVKKPMMPATEARPVLIMGAGISGLCLAQALKRHNVPFRVFERDAAVDSRPQGYRLKLRRDAAVALAESLPAEVYRTFQTSCANLAIGETDFNPFTGLVVNSRAGGGLSGKLGLHPSYCVDRAAFRATLMSGIEGRVRFSKEMTSCEMDEDRGVVTVTFRDGESAEGRFLVGADGLHSVVRRHLVPAHTIKDTGAACIYGKTPMSPAVLERFPEKGMRWMTIVSDQPPMLQSCIIGDAPVTLLLEPIRFSQVSRSQHQLPADYIYWALIGPEARFRVDGETPPTSKVDGGGGGGGSSTSAQAASTDAARLSLSITQEWHPSLRSVLEHQVASQATLIRVVSSVPDVPAWPPSAMATLLGDAVHPMSPCGGVGAQTAICDACSLAETIAAAQGSPTAEEIGAFEEAMRIRARRSILQSEMGSKKMFGLRSLEDCGAWNGL
ncbi:6-hydroxytryprostatin B O-methyltransferase [Colletotrichum tanaceti]|uniref:6-hydroxytryprostatin B O-methyltransferase n=1 Tax=Colletotrichum tanaceti TaxID=1306861 RepID=A0A4V6DHW8_9PEZI|nr:6-hydroxytryprostatin B O-methyltransferase [Colletotrichum tanaceti]TKW58186.1 6-hydroxytryprostatin B O-methyltransferase [Colletotrichum tanaceti]